MMILIIFGFTGCKGTVDFDESTWATINNWVYANYTNLNVWTPEQVAFEMEFDYRAELDDIPGHKCKGQSSVTFGGINIFANAMDSCEDYGVSKNKISQVIERTWFSKTIL